MSDIKCPICLNTFTDPRVLGCGHSLCLLCIQSLSSVLGKKACPVCRSLTVPFKNNVQLLAKNYAIASVVEGKRKRVQCPSCEDSVLPSRLLHCVPDNITVCAACLIEKHDGHERQTMVERKREKLNDEVQSVSKELKEAAEMAGEVKMLAQLGADMETSISALSIIFESDMTSYINSASDIQALGKTEALVNELKDKASVMACQLSRICQNAITQFGLVSEVFLKLMKRLPSARPYKHRYLRDADEIDWEEPPYDVLGYIKGIVSWEGDAAAVVASRLPQYPSECTDYLRKAGVLAPTGDYAELLCSISDKGLVDWDNLEEANKHAKKCGHNDLKDRFWEVTIVKLFAVQPNNK